MLLGMRALLMVVLMCMAILFYTLLRNWPKTVVFRPNGLPLVCVLMATTSRNRFDALVLSVPSLPRTLERNFNYELWIGLDKGETIQPGLAQLAYPVPIHVVEVHNPLRKPGPVFNNISAAAVESGCEYLYRINDDTELLGQWTSKFVKALQGFDPPNVGIVGPTCHEGNSAILTHDFVHRTHHAIFGYHYPSSLTDWWLDDWISQVYGPKRTLKLPDVVVRHHLLPTSYNVTFANQALLHTEVQIGRRSIKSYLGEDVLTYIGQHKQFAKLPDPVIVIFGNHGFLPLMLNFICNLRNFPRTMQHMLMVVPDLGTAQVLLDMRLPFTVGVTDMEVTHSDHDYESTGYKDLLIWRSETLFTLLGRQKRVLCMEADVILYQELVEQPEIMTMTTDLTVYLDPKFIGAGFLLFAPTAQAKRFYSDVVHMLHTKTIMDNDILTKLIQKNSNYSIFDKCRYRSGVFIKYPHEYSCEGPPVIQQLNWVIGLQGKINMAKAHRGWFLTADQKCAQRDLRAVIMTMNRAQSLARLLESVGRSDALIDIHVSVDVEGEVNAGVMDVIKKAQIAWGERGFFTYKVWDRHMGILGNWVDSWEAELYDADLYKAVVLLEDDLEVCPQFAKWFIGAHEAYKDPRVGSVTGQRGQLVARGGGPFTVGNGIKAFAYRLLATWSHSPTHANWVAFRTWMKTKNDDIKPYVDNIIPNDWYRQFEEEGTQDGMWEMWYIKFSELKNSFTVYPWVENGTKTIVCNWREKGLHFDIPVPSCDYPLLENWDKALLLQKPLQFHDWDMKPLSNYLLPRPSKWLCVSGDLYGRTGNQLNAVGYGLWYARHQGWAGLQILTNCSSNEMHCPSFHQWKQNIEIPSNLVFTTERECAETKGWRELYFAQLDARGDPRWAPPIPTAAVRLQAEAAWSGVRASVHGRSFEGYCASMSSICPSRVVNSEHRICDYSKSVIERQPGFNRAKLSLGSFDWRLFTDHQSPPMDQTFSIIDDHPFMVQLWMMVLSDVHIGTPGSSLDYLVWIWKQKMGLPGVMFPLDCYTHPTNQTQ